MPLYEYECPDCEEITEDFRQISDRAQPMECKCGGLAEKIISPPYRDRAWENGITLDHVELHPKHFRTRQELRSYCKKKGLTSSALL